MIKLLTGAIEMKVEDQRKILLEKTEKELRSDIDKSLLSFWSMFFNSGVAMNAVGNRLDNR